MVNLALVIDGSDVMADFRADEVFEGWGTDKSIIRRAERFAEAAKPSLFSPEAATRLYLRDTSSIKSMTTVFEDAGDSVDFIYSGFVIIAPGANRNSTKKLEKLVSNAGGTVIASKSKDGTSNVETMLKDLYVPSHVKGFLSDHVGSSVDKLIPIYKAVYKLGKKQQSNISIEDMLIRVSPNAGEIPPWDIEAPLLKGDVTAAIRTARRVMVNSHPVLVISVLKNSLSRLHRIRMMTAAGVTDDKEIIKATGNMSPKQASFLIGRAKKYSLAQTGGFVSTIADYEDRIKGKEPLDNHTQIEVMLVKIAMIAQGAQ